MRSAILIRHANATAAPGVLVLDTGWTCQTLELPWQDNQQNISCIPEGHYTCLRHRSATKGDCFAVFDVPARADVLIHVGNYLADTQGCILVGLERAGDGQSIEQSAVALHELLREAPDGFALRIMSGMM